MALMGSCSLHARAETYIGLYVKCLLLLFDFNENLNLVTGFVILPSGKFNADPFSRSWFVKRGQGDGRTNRQDEAKTLIFLNFSCGGSQQFKNFLNVLRKLVKKLKQRRMHTFSCCVTKMQGRTTI
jgi:hypothetical protein